MKTAGLIFDVYDDSDRQILAALFEYAPPGEKIASSRLLSPEHLGRLPNHVFALVADNGGSGPLRKYAMHDEAHLKLSVAYFLETGHHLPEEAQKVAARNLVRGCQWYDVDPPEALTKIALVGAVMHTAGLASDAKDGLSKHKQTMAAYRAAKTVGAPKMASEFDYLDAELGLNKEADLTGTSIMPTSGPTKAPPTSKSGTPKTAAAQILEAFGDEWEHAGDLTWFEGHVQEKVASHSRFCLPHAERYPIDSYEQVKQASAYFEEHWQRFSPAERRVYADNLVARAEEIGVKVAGRAMDYAGRGYGPHVRAELIKRASAYEGTGHEVGYRALLEKLSSVPAHVMAALIQEADVKVGADRVYWRQAGGFRDPYAAVYGVAKTASAEFSWSNESGVSVDGAALARLASSGADKLRSAFGGDFAESFAQDPVGIFESMPEPQKAAIARMAAGV